MTSPYQPAAGLKKLKYTAVENSLLEYDKAISFPILSVINGYATQKEAIEIIYILSDYENARINYEAFKIQLNELCVEKDITYKIAEVEIPYNELIETQLNTFQKLINCVNDNDTLYACITFGSKPVPMIETMALNYAYRLHENVKIGCIVYGQLDHNTGEMRIYDITSLFYMDEIVRMLAEQKVSEPKKQIEALLNL